MWAIAPSVPRRQIRQQCMRKHGGIHLSMQRLRHGGGEAAYGSKIASLVQWEKDVISE